MRLITKQNKINKYINKKQKAVVKNSVIYCTSSASNVYEKRQQMAVLLSNLLEKSSNFRQLLKNFGATFWKFWSNLFLRLSVIDSSICKRKTTTTTTTTTKQNKTKIHPVLSLFHLVLKRIRFLTTFLSLKKRVN